jgi:hypothetical protein
MPAGSRGSDAPSDGSGIENPAAWVCPPPP